MRRLFDKELALYYDPDRIVGEFDAIATMRARLFGRTWYMYDFLMGYWERSANRELVRMITSSGKRGRILEMGVGTGHLLTALGENFPESEIHGVDYSIKMLEAANTRLRRENLDAKIALFHGDCLDMPIAPRSYDIIVSSFLLDIQSPERVLALLEKSVAALAPNGSMFFAVLNADIVNSYGRWWERRYFHGASEIYKRLYRSVWARKISRSLFRGYFTHCRPIDLRDYVAKISGVTVLRQTESSVSVLGVSLLPVKIMEIAEL